MKRKKEESEVIQHVAPSWPRRIIGLMALSCGLSVWMFSGVRLNGLVGFHEVVEDFFLVTWTALSSVGFILMVFDFRAKWLAIIAAVLWITLLASAVESVKVEPVMAVQSVGIIQAFANGLMEITVICYMLGWPFALILNAAFGFTITAPAPLSQPES